MAYDKVVDSTQLDADLKIVADAIRSKGGTTEQLSFPQGMKQAVEAIQTGIIPTGTIEITENGTHDVSNYASANVNVASGGGSDKWWDFTVEATSDITKTTGLIDLFSPYLSNLQPMKDFAIITMQKADISPVNTSGVPLILYMYKILDTEAFDGGVVRYRSVNSLSTPIVITSNSGISVLAGYVFYVKVVNILV